ncbi:MAG: hypothetical protein J6T48_05500 [Bacteroidales bacterium]|nr:hypothetical protein [Bacteroidales bacterium]
MDNKENSMNKSIDFSSVIKDEHVMRKNALNCLFNYMIDEGRFSILLLGSHGVGKTYWIDRIVNFIKEQSKDREFYMSKIININCCICAGKDENFWNDIFMKADGGLLVFDHVEFLDRRSQFILFEILSPDHGKFGYFEKNIACRVIFSSSYKIESLRDAGSPLVPNFFGRISNFVVKLPDFSECSNNIEKDFTKTWDKMCYPKPHDKKPFKKFYDWLNGNVHKFHGNFRDLDNLSINWHNCRVNGLSEDETYEIVVDTFEKFNHYPEHGLDFDNFTIDQGMDYYAKMLPNFRSFVKNYAKRIYGNNLKKAPNGKPFGVPYRTMDRW